MLNIGGECIMRAHEFITETPLPSDWDKTVYTKKTPYKKRIEYAVARAQQLGKGTARTAVEIEYEGRPTVLKVAHNAKGMAQNAAESKILSDPAAPDILIPIIDYDEENPQPTWIHTEKAEKATDKQLSKILKTPKLEYLVMYAIYSKMGTDVDKLDRYIRQFIKEADMETFYKNVDKLIELNIYFNVNLGDCKGARNWGIYNGEAKIIDVGFTEEVAKLYR